MHDISAAQIHFKQVDPRMHQLLRAGHEHALMQVNRPRYTLDQYFERLAESIVSQQLSIKAADTIWGRFVKLVDAVEPERVTKVALEDLRGVGLSNAKARYVTGLAQDILDKNLILDELDSLEDEVVIERLTRVKGIGRWSAEMFLMFTLARPDVFGVGDLGLVRSVESVYDRPGITPAELTDLALTWAPHRTLAALMLWHSRDNQG